MQPPKTESSTPNLPHNPNGRRNSAAINQVDYQADQLARTLAKTNSKFAEFVSDLGARLEGVISPTLGIKSGVYDAFGNNFATRGAMGVMDSVLGATEGIFGEKEKEAEPTKDPILLAIENQTKSLISIIGELKGSGSSLSPDAMDAYSEQLKTLSESIKKLADKDCCDDTESLKKLDILSEQVQTIIGLLGNRGEDMDDRKKQNSPKKILIETEKKQLIALTNISKVLVSHTKMFEKLPKEKISDIGDVYKQPKAIEHKNYIDVESREVKPKEEIEDQSSGILGTISKIIGGIFGMIKKAGMGLVTIMSSIVKRVAGIFGDTGKKVVSGVGSILPKILGSKGKAAAALLGVGAGAYAMSDADSFFDSDEKSDEPTPTIGTDLSIPPIVPFKTGNKSPDIDPKTGKPTVPANIPDGKDIDPKTGKPTVPDVKPNQTVPANIPDNKDIDPKTGKPTVPDAPGKIGKIGKALSKGARFIPGVGLAIAAADMTYSAYSGAKDSSDIFGTADTSLSQDVSGAIGGVAESLSFGLLDRESIAKKTHSMYNSITEGDTNKQREIENIEQQIKEKEAAPKSSGSGGESPVIVNNVTNNQTFSSVRKYVENPDVSYRRYVDSVFKTV